VQPPSLLLPPEPGSAMIWGVGYNDLKFGVPGPWDSEIAGYTAFR
jgi:hypothetical protein